MTVGRLTQNAVEVLYNTDPNVRLTQDVVEVLYNTDPNVRATQVVLEVIVLPDLASALLESTSSIEFIGRLKTNKQGSVNLTTFASSDFTGNYTTHGTVDLNSSSSFVGDTVEKVLQTLSVSDVATGEAIKNTGSNVLLTQSISLDTVLNRSLTDTIIFQDSVGLNQVNNLSGNSQLLLSDIAIANKIFTETASSILTFTSTADYSFPTNNILNLTQIATAEITKIFEEVLSSLSISNTVSLDTVLNLSLIDIINFTQLAIGNFEKTKTPTSSLDLNDFAYASTNINNFILKSQSNAIVLPNPLLNDSENLMSTLDLKRTITGEKYTYVKRQNRRKLNYTFRVDQSKASELKQFIEINNSSEVQIENWKGERWKGYIVSNPFDFIQNVANGIDIELVFEGEKQNA